MIFNICGNKKRPEVAKMNSTPTIIINRISFLQKLDEAKLLFFFRDLNIKRIKTIIPITINKRIILIIYIGKKIFF